MAEGTVHDASGLKKTKPKRGGASTMASTPAICQSRAVTYSPKLGHLAVANNKGHVTIREVDRSAVDQGFPGSLDNIKKTLFKDLKKAAK